MLVRLSGLVSLSLFIGLPCLLSPSPPRLSLPLDALRDISPSRRKFALADLRNGDAAWLYTPRLPPSPVLVRGMGGALRKGFGVLEGRMGEEKSAPVAVEVEVYPDCEVLV
jgi:hypothetical protein